MLQQLELMENAETKQNCTIYFIGSLYLEEQSLHSYNPSSLFNKASLCI